MSGAAYVLSQRAAGDLAAIYEFGLDSFGPIQAMRYVEQLEVCFNRLAANPRMGRSAERLGRAVRRHEHGSHVVFYSVAADGVLILNVRHRSMIADLDL